MSKTVVIAGAASGIGAACAARFGAEGWRVIGWDRAVGSAPEVQWSEVDVTDNDRLHDLASSLGPIDIAINSAGIAVRKVATATTKEEWDRVVSVNLNGAFYFAHALYPRLCEAAGVLVNIASVTAHVGLTERVAYSATKAAIISLTRTLAIEWARDDVRVFSISPTFVDTPLIQHGVASGQIDLAQILDQTPQRRLLSPQEVAGCIFRLGGPDFVSITGSDVLLDGGFVAYGGF
jgi:NAD(P)-dependent dehydrogenase (short-subunit alcohol dehydrogenase family)